MSVLKCQLFFCFFFKYKQNEEEEEIIFSCAEEITKDVEFLLLTNGKWYNGAGE